MGVAPGVRRMDSAGVGPDTVAGAVLEAVGELGPLDGTPAAVGLGLSGFEIAAEPDLRRIADVLRERLGPAPVAIATDGATSLLGALEGRPGAVVAAGTGTVAMAWNGERWAKVDGTGSLLGDAGSGFAIGRAGLDLALRHHDGRGGSEALAAAAADRFGPLDQLPLRDQPRRPAHARGRGLRARRGRAGARRRARRHRDPGPRRTRARPRRAAPPSGACSPPATRPRCRAPATCSAPVTR